MIDKIRIATTIASIVSALSILPAVAGHGGSCPLQGTAASGGQIVGNAIRVLLAGQPAKTTPGRAEVEATLRSRGWAGMQLEKNAGRITVAEVVEGSPAAGAGLREGDVLLKVDGVALTKENHAELNRMRADMTPGTRVKYTIERDGKSKRIAVTLARIPAKVLASWVDRALSGDSGVEFV